MKDISYGVRELQAHLGRALRAVEKGDRVIVTSRGRPIATISGADRSVGNLSPIERKVRRLASEGKLVLGKEDPIPDFPAPRLSGLSRQVLSDRR
ncbi:MAG: type II toxin-antitoxin system prevent-host-death family antitoxin [Planctomycetes bacterium]|nr:type II toxin-antitoxin system prevent-host-death family antitoxin [Planctomycetota bacterium]